MSSVLLFPGLGVQKPNMGQELYGRSESIRELYEIASGITKMDIPALCFGNKTDSLSLPTEGQLALFVTEYAAYIDLIEQTGIKPQYIMGHSFGEIVALTCAGAMSFEDSVKLILMRGKIIDEFSLSGIGSMAVVSSGDVDMVSKACEEASLDGQIVVISNYNSPRQIVVSGHRNALDRLYEILGLWIVPLNAFCPFHSILMREAAESFSHELSKLSFHPFQIPLISNVTARPYRDEKEIENMLLRHMVEPVLWLESIQFALEQGVTNFVDVGPQQILKGLCLDYDADFPVLSWEQEPEKTIIDLTGMQQSAQTHIFHHTLVTLCILHAVTTRNNESDSRIYDEGVSAPFARIIKMQTELTEANKKPSVQQSIEAVQMLKSVFSTKGVPYTEQKERWSEIKAAVHIPFDVSKMISIAERNI